MTPIADRIVQGMQHRGLTVSTMAAAIGVQPYTVTRWVRGKMQPSPDSLRRLATLFDCPVSWLQRGVIEDEDDPS